MKKISVIAVVTTCCLMFSACEHIKIKVDSATAFNPSQMKIEEVTEPEELTDETEHKKKNFILERLDIFPSEFAGEYTFTSGEGGWSTGLTLNADGSFEGRFVDANLGEAGEGYVSTIYECDFSGKFKIKGKINEYSYYVTLSQLKFEQKGEVIKDEIRFVSSTPVGVEKGEGFILYTPKAPVDILDQKFMGWCFSDYRSEGSEQQEIGSYGIYNLEAKTAFFSRQEKTADY